MKHIFIYIALLSAALCSCKNTKAIDTADTMTQPTGPTFSADSAYAYCKAQCDFGPRLMNTKAHDDCRDWIAQEFRRHGCTVTLQPCHLTAFDGTTLNATNIIARYTPKHLNDSTAERMLLCAHYDTRSWADNDPDEKNHKEPVMGANDGASGVAVMLEVARLVSQADSANVGIDFICFDAEDYGTPQWYEGSSVTDETWALGSAHWAQQYAAGQTEQNNLKYGILLDMVGGIGAKFYYEGFSLEYAKPLVQKVWAAATAAGYGSYFVCSQGGYITDDHVSVNTVAQIPCVDIIGHYPDCPQSNFGPTWHTVNDTMENISKETLQAAGQTVIQMLYGWQ